MKIKLAEGTGFHSVHPDYSFVKPLLEQFTKLPKTMRVYFPKLEGGLKESDATASLGYHEHQPAVTFTFFSTPLGMTMLYKAVVIRKTVDGKPGLQLTMVPTGKLNRRLYRAYTTDHNCLRSAVEAIIKNYGVGSVCRKIHSEAPTK